MKDQNIPVAKPSGETTSSVLLCTFLIRGACNTDLPVDTGMICSADEG